MRKIADFKHNYVSFLVSEFDQRLRLLYHVINKRALSVALGIIGLLGIIMITYVCASWCYSDKRGYSIPPAQTKRQDENDSSFEVDTHLLYNRFVLTITFTCLSLARVTEARLTGKVCFRNHIIFKSAIGHE